MAALWRWQQSSTAKSGAEISKAEGSGDVRLTGVLESFTTEVSSHQDDL